MNNNNNLHSRMPVKVKLNRAIKMMADIDDLIARNSFTHAELTSIKEAKREITAKIKTYQRQLKVA